MARHRTKRHRNDLTSFVRIRSALPQNTLGGAILLAYKLLVTATGMEEGSGSAKNVSSRVCNEGTSSHVPEEVAAY